MHNALNEQNEWGDINISCPLHPIFGGLTSPPCPTGIDAPVSATARIQTFTIYLGLQRDI